MFVPFLLSYMFGLYVFLSSIQLDVFSTVMTQGLTLLATGSLFLIGLALLYVTRPRKITSLLWLPFVYAYLSVQSLIALYAVFQIVLRRPKNWVKTAKTGVISNSR